MDNRDKTSPHIVHMIDELPRDGAEMLLVDLMRLRIPGYRYTIVCLIKGGPLEQEFEKLGVPVVIFGRKGKLDFGLVFRVASWLKRERADVVHTHLFTADTYGRLAARLAGVPAVFSTVHNIVNPWKGSGRKLIDRLFARLSTAVVGCSEEVTQTLATRDKIPASKLVSIPNGIDLQKFSNFSGAGLRSEFGLPEDRPLIGIVGRLHEQKAHGDLFRALTELPQVRDKKLNCLVIGTGDLQDTLKQQVKALGLEDCVIFTGMRTDVPRLVAAMDVFVMSSHWEGLPIALLEAMASSKAVLCTRVGGIPDVVIDGDNGLLVEPRDVPQFAKRLDDLLQDPALRARMGQRARETVIARFDVSRTAAAYNRLHQQALGLSSEPQPAHVAPAE
ncbi:MAG: group 1 glycosyl transferase [Thiomonas sp. 14-64-326]|jgi:glycosyltransferase involved in cell wall biosynthesis|uniref:glycosyltransferase n=1 Tax=Thiomonas sp. TaxID=2047785 RepID=UPI000BC3C684|nr:glycosyltransferase [Thiomonas sp.]OZB75206.1 MAG: group 1 glycosyl transferase [Thiomonas sp. 14-64-326]